MLRNVLIPIILLACLLAASCGGGSSIERESAKKGYDYYKALSDVDVCGCPATVRCFIVKEEGAPDCDDWEWFSDRGRISDVSADGLTAWVTMDKPGAVHVWARGVDKDGKDCTTPRHKITCARGHNSPPVVTDFSGPRGPFPGEEIGADGIVRRYHEWRWPNAQGYDPEEIEVVSWHWGVYDGPDDDGDGFGDTLLAWKAADGSVHSTIPEQLKIRESPTRNSFAVRVYQLAEVDREVRIIVTVADSARKERKWSDGHVTLMK